MRGIQEERERELMRERQKDSQSEKEIVLQKVSQHNYEAKIVGKMAKSSNNIESNHICFATVIPFMIKI